MRRPKASVPMIEQRLYCIKVQKARKSFRIERQSRRKGGLEIKNDRLLPSVPADAGSHLQRISYLKYSTKQTEYATLFLKCACYARPQNGCVFTLSCGRTRRNPLCGLILPIKTRAIRRTRYYGSILPRRGRQAYCLYRRWSAKPPPPYKHCLAGEAPTPPIGALYIICEYVRQYRGDPCNPLIPFLFAKKRYAKRNGKGCDYY